jgi:ABC-2 type transport system permease protein
LLSAPIFLAYAARYAFESELAFYGVLLIDLLVAGIVYAIALQSAVEAAEERKEELIMALSSSQGPVAS